MTNLPTDMSKKQAIEVVAKAQAEYEAQQKETALKELAKGTNQQSDRWQEQCILQANMESLSNLKKQYQREYQYIDVFETDNNHSPTEFVNRLYKKQNSQSFVDISTFDRSKLSWFMKLSKVIYDVTGNPGAGYSNAFKKEVPIIFEKMAREDIEHYEKGDKSKFHTGLSPQPDEIPLGRPPVGYGMKSFSWNFVGSNPERVRNDITAKLVLVFQDFNQLSKIRVDKDSGLEYSLLDLLGYGPNQEGKRKNPRHKDPYQDTYDSQWFEIRADVGWYPHEFDARGSHFSKDDAKKLTDSVKGQRHSLYLTLVDHNFNISQIGTFTLTLDYRARLGGVLTKAKTNVIFRPDDIVYAKKDRGKPYDEREIGDYNNEDIGSVLEVEKEIYDRQQKGGPCTSAGDLRILQSAYQQRINMAKKSSFEEFLKSGFIDKKKHRDREQHNSARTGLTGPELTLQSGVGDPLSQVYFGKVDVAKFINYVDGASNDIPSIQPHVKTTPEDSLDSYYSDTTATEKQLNETDIGKFLNRPTLRDTASGEESIYWVYAGDILEEMCHRALDKSNFSSETSYSPLKPEDADKIKILLSPYQFGLGDNKVNISLADIPISLPLFQDFWYRNVIQNNRTVYRLLDFIRDFFDQLVTKSLESACGVTDSTGVQKVQFRTSLFSLASKNGKDPLLHLDEGCYSKTNGSILMHQLGSTDQRTLLQPEKDLNIEINKQFQYLVVTGEAVTDNTLNGDADKDLDRGIHHLYINKGILQSINFEKSDQPYLREARFERLDENPLVHLSSVYNVSMSMFGNVLFFPGQTIFINPLGFGASLGDPSIGPTKEKPDLQPSLSNVMGLGGYHTIISVSNTIDRDFTTSVTALWTGNGTNRSRSPWNQQGNTPCSEGGE